MKLPTRVARRIDEAAANNPLRTVVDLRLWLWQCATHPDGKPWTTKRQNEALLWWYALEEVTNGAWADMSTRTIANILITGLKPLRLAAIQEMLDEIWDLGGDSRPDAYRTSIEARLNEHFNPKPRSSRR